jgi:GT2 family glycosyltransferase
VTPSEGPPEVRLPTVSVIVVAYRSTDPLAACLAALHAHRSDESCEVIVVGNGIPSAVRAVIDAAPGVRCVSCRANLGFAGGCNLGASVARGEWLVFLNDDAIVQEGWLDALMSFAREHPLAGAIGSLVLGPDGTVFEAGAGFGPTGHPQRHDRGTPVEEVAARGARRVGYVSGCSLLTPHSLFRELGGFDASFYPGYFEDVDYNLRVRESGREIWFVPDSRIVHLESASTSSQAKAFMNEWSQQRYNTKWSFPAPVTDPDVPNAVQNSGLGSVSVPEPGATETDLVLRELAFQRELTEAFRTRVPALEQENLRLLQENTRARAVIAMLEAEQNRPIHRFADALARFCGRIPLVGRVLRAISLLVGSAQTAKGPPDARWREL